MEVDISNNRCLPFCIDNRCSRSYYTMNAQMSKVSIEDDEDCLRSPAFEDEGSCTQLRLMYPAAGAVFMAALAIGAAIGYPAMAISSIIADAAFGSAVGAAMEKDSTNIAWFNSIVALAALLGAFIAGPLANSTGRKPTIIIACVPFTIGWILVAVAEDLSVLFGGRILTGISTGMICVAGPIYIVEVSSHSARGLLGGLFGGIMSTGILLCGIFGGLVLEWRGLAFLNATLPALTTIAFLFLPESPKLLVSKGRFDEAVQAMKRLHGNRIDARLEVFVMKDQCEHHEEFSMRDIFSKATLKAAGIAISLMLFQGFSGINAVIMYAVPIFRTAAPSVNPIYCTIMLQALQALFNAIASPITNRFGRKVPSVISTLGVCVSLSGFAFYQHSNTDSHVWVPVLCCMTAVISFAIGLGPLPWLIVAEISPTRTAGLISALATSTAWASFFILIRTFDSLVTALSSPVVFWIYSGWCFVGVLFSIFLLPETANKSHYEIQMMLEGRTFPKELENEGARDSPKVLVHNEQDSC
ncbi:facilitated trehalose transporter Tret1-like isoform X1 [Varroa destructor]|uniref:Major facilitator superfamily (MFS) profile domain-containing protein n=1 Tax=Varroa destructor TaxID=109461 RepID=A0A7M7MJB1_VARDE|nr:facilitated trehalose transporter Tret1-like isoform X1 [Varroa destructor]